MSQSWDCCEGRDTLIGVGGLPSSSSTSSAPKHPPTSAEPFPGAGPGQASLCPSVAAARPAQRWGVQAGKHLLREQTIKQVTVKVGKPQLRTGVESVLTIQNQRFASTDPCSGIALAHPPETATAKQQLAPPCPAAPHSTSAHSRPATACRHHTGSGLTAPLRAGPGFSREWRGFEDTSPKQQEADAPRAGPAPLCPAPVTGAPGHLFGDADWVISKAPAVLAEWLAWSRQGHAGLQRTSAS